jgi:hypothetical protein
MVSPSSDPTAPRPVSASLIEARLAQLLGELDPHPVAPRGQGRPAILPATILWTAVAVGVLRGFASQQAIWRLVSLQGLWTYPRIPISDKAIYKRIATDGPSVLTDLFTEITGVLLATAPEPVEVLAPFAPAIVALDESTLDQVARTLPILRDVPPGDRRLLPGKVAAVFDVRRQLFRHVAFIANPSQNEKAAARTLLAAVPPGSLVLADLGYFGFRWFDELTAQGYSWVSRLRQKTSLVPVHTLYQDATLTDELVWLGAYRADRAAHLVRLVSIRHGATVHRYLTNVRDPRQFPAADVAAVYGERWSIEQAFKVVKRDLGLHLLWSAKPAVVEAQLWAVVLIAQVLGAIRGELAAQAGVAIAEVSLPLLIETLPALAARHDDPLALLVAEGRRFHIIRPTRRHRCRTPPVDPDQYVLPPPDLLTKRPPRYAGRL